MVAFTGTGSIRGRGMAMDPALGMNDIGDAGAGAADREFVSCRRRTCGFPDLFSAVRPCPWLSTMNSMLLRVVKRRWPSQCLSAISQISRMWVTLIKTGAAGSDRINFIAGFGDMNQNARFQNFMIQPFTLIFSITGG